MAKSPNRRIEISEDARRALDFEVALTGESLFACASRAILNGVSDEANAVNRYVESIKPVSN